MGLKKSNNSRQDACYYASPERWDVAMSMSFLVAATVATILFSYGMVRVTLGMESASTDISILMQQHHQNIRGAAVLSWLVLFLLLGHLTLTLRLLALHVPIVHSFVPLLGHALRFTVQTPWDSMLQWHKEYGEILSFTLMGRTMVSLANPQHLKQALQSKIRAVKKDVGFSYQPFLVILGNGIVTSEDKDWMKQRLKMSTALRITVLDVIPRVTLKAVQRLMVTLDKAAANAREGVTVDVVEALRHLTLQVISNTFLSISFDESDSTFGKLYLPIVDECNTRVWHPYRAVCFFLPSWWQHWYRVRQLNTYVSNLIQNRWHDRVQSGLRKDDILDHVLDAYEKDHPQHINIPTPDVVQIRDEFKTFMLAGHETSAAMMTWAIYEMMANPSLIDEVLKESEAVFGKDKNWAQEVVLPPRDKFAELAFTEGCLKESLRKYSVIPLAIRRVVTDLDLGDYQIPAGSTLALHIQAVHHNPIYWPDPMSFNPRRFIDRKPSPYTFIPFLEGPRNCLGQHLSLLESKIVLALLMQRYNFSSNEVITTRLDCKATDPRHQYMVPVNPKKSLDVVVSLRS